MALLFRSTCYLTKIGQIPQENSFLSKLSSSNGTYPWIKWRGQKRPVLWGKCVQKRSFSRGKSQSLISDKVLIKKWGLGFSHKKRVFLRCVQSVCFGDNTPFLRLSPVGQVSITLRRIDEKEIEDQGGEYIRQPCVTFVKKLSFVSKKWLHSRIGHF